jgi:hypothetical protein
MTPVSAFHCQLRHVVVALGLVAGWLLFSGSEGESLAGAAAAPDTCGAGSSTLTATMPPASGQPGGISLSPLADGEIDQLPPPPARLFLSRISLGPGTTVATQAAAGPILYYVEAGTVSIIIAGDPVTYGPSQAALVPMDELYALVNPSGTDPVSLLRLAVTPTSVVSVPVADFLVPPPVDVSSISTAPNAPPSQSTSALLFRADLNVLPPQPFRLLLACAAWTAPPDPASSVSFSGPVGIRIVSGTLLLGEDRKIGETGCTLFEPGQALSVGPGDQPPSGVLFGLLPAGVDLWQAAPSESPTGSVVNVSCGSI